MPADRPDVAGLHKGGFLQRGGQVEIIILRFITVPGIERGQFFFIKSGERHIEAHKYRYYLTFTANKKKTVSPEDIEFVSENPEIATISLTSDSYSRLHYEIKGIKK